MSRKRVVEIVTDGGHNYGQISHPNDLGLAQDYAHQHVESATKDFLTQNDPECAGLGYTLQANTLNFNVAEGRVYHQGVQFDALATALTLNAAHANHARLDYIVATIAGNQPAQTEMVPFQRIRTSQELAANTPPYAPTQFSRARERQNIATIQVRTGTPSVSPQPPVLQPTDVVLYVVTVPANATSIAAGNVNNVRKVVGNLSATKEQIVALQTQNAALQTKINQMESGALLVLKYRYPTIVTEDSKVPAVVVNDGGTWSVDISVGTTVQFGDGFVGVRLENFEDENLNPRYASTGGAVDNKPIFDGKTDFMEDFELPPGTAVIRFDAPTTTKAIYLLRDGKIVTRTAITPSNSDECLLMKIIPNGSASPVLKRYINARNSVAKYDGTAVSGNAASRQFENDLATPTGVGYFDIWGTKAADKYRYDISGLGSYAFDSLITLPDEFANGDAWHVRYFILSGL